MPIQFTPAMVKAALQAFRERSKENEAQVCEFLNAALVARERELQRISDERS